VFGSDGTFDSSKFNVAGNYISFFAPDVTTIGANAALVASFNKQFPGGTSPFGAPNYVLGQMYATALVNSCRDNRITRAEVRRNLAKVKLAKTIFGQPIRFTATGDVANAKFFIFRIESGGTYKTVG
jgi:hypothetical protein